MRKEKGVFETIQALQDMFQGVGVQRGYTGREESELVEAVVRAKNKEKK